jgi:type IV conjugative transfer system lipoprotein TraV
MNIIKKTFKQSLNLMNLTIRLAVITSLSLAAACSIHKGEFDCPGNKGMGCKGMIDVYDMLHQKTPLAPVSNVVSNSSAGHDLAKKTSIDTNQSANIANSEVTSQGAAKPIYRNPDKIIKIWFNGYFDRMNNYRDSQYVYSVISPASWVINNR